MDHLPECLAKPCDCRPRSVMCRCADCICDRLRACEQRLLTNLVPNLHIADTQGFNRGLRQAQEAVAGLRTYGDHGEVIPPDEEAAVIYVTDALAAIDALRKKP